MARPTKTTLALVALAALAALLAAPAAALAADPPAAPMTVTAGSGDAASGTFGFESASYTDLTWGANPDPPGYTALTWWGRIGNTKHAGTYGLWCAGSRPSKWALYPDATDAENPVHQTSGRATLALPQLADFYSSSVSFWWVQPSYGDADSSSFAVFWENTSTSQIDSFSYFSKKATWQSKAFDLSATSGNTANLSRQPGRVMFEFNDKVEGGSYITSNGQGASIDDVTVTGYRYGPVRSASALPKSTNLQVSWLKPYRATGSTSVEERSLNYKVWRRTANPGPGAWTELTPGGGTASLSLADADPPDGVVLEYRVHAWEPSGSAYGQPVTVTVDQPPALSDNAQPAYSSSANIVLTATDTSGVGSIFYRKDGGGTQSVAGGTANVNFTGDGPHSLEWWATDFYGSESDHLTRDFTIDSALPEVSADVQQYYGASPALVHITGSHPSGIESVSWRIDGGGTQSQSGDSGVASVAGEGLHSVEYWCTSSSDVESPHVTEGLTIDLTDPVPAHDGVGHYLDSATINVSATDALSGVAILSWRVDGGPTQTDATAPFEGTVVVAADGSHTLEIWAEDMAGNTGTVTHPFGVGPLPAERLADRTRFSTAVAIARESFDADQNPANGTQWTGVTDVVIASGDDRAAADPLAASGLCWAYDAPLFLVGASSTPSEVKAAIKEIALQNADITVHIVGGPVSVPTARYSEITAYVGAGEFDPVDRLLSTGGRYDMAAAIAKRMQDVSGSKPTTVLIANGADSTKFFDALALSPIAARNGYPILLVTTTSVPSATQARLNAIGPATVIVGGGTNTVSESVRASLSAVRWSGRTRYDTAIKIADEALAADMLDDQAVGIAAKLPDALTGGSMVGRAGGVLLLTDGTALTPVTGTWLTAHKANITRCFVFGGVNSVSSAVLNGISARLQ